MPIGIYSSEVIKQKLNYVHQNPVLAGYVTEAIYYPYSSAYDYGGGNGLLALALLE